MQQIGTSTAAMTIPAIATVDIMAFGILGLRHTGSHMLVFREVCAGGHER